MTGSVRPVLTRPQIPHLQDIKHPAASRVIVGRSFRYGRQEPMRLCRGETLMLRLALSDVSSGTILVTLLTNLDSQDPGFFYEIPYEAKDRGVFECRLRPQKCGAFVFRTKYSTNGGETWGFDQVPFSRVLVDPEGVAGLRIYSLIPAVSSTISSWKEELHRIHKMGFNAVHLLPVTKMDKSESPYAADDLFSIDPSFLDQNDKREGLEQFEDFVEEAKMLGIKLCFDLVLNHIGISSQISSRAPGWIVADSAQEGGFKRAGCWHGREWITWKDLALLNYDHPDETEREAMWTYMSQYALFWAYYADYTGGLVRFDNLHSSTPEFITSLTRLLRAHFPNLIILAELFSDEDTVVERVSEWQLNLLVATPWEHRFVPELREYLAYLHRVSGRARYLSPITSHDSGTPAQEFAAAISTVPRYLVCALLSCGASGIVQGVEWGVEKKVAFIGRNGALKKSKDHDFSPFISKVNELLAAYPEFQKGGGCTFIDGKHKAIIAGLRYDPPRGGRFLLVAANFDIHGAHTLEVDLDKWLSRGAKFSVRELLSDSAQSDWCGKIKIPLKTCEGKVYLLQRQVA